MTDFVSIWSEAAPQPPFEPSLRAPETPEIVQEVEERMELVEEAFEEAEPEPEPEPELDLDALVAEIEAKARAQARAELGPEREALKAEQERTAALGRELASLRGRVMDGLSGDIAAIVLGLSRRVVGDALALHPEALRRVLDGAVGRFPDSSGLHVRVAPEDLERVRTWLPDAEVVADESVSGGCVVSGDEGTIDASLEAVFEGIDAAVEAWRQERQ